MCWNASKGERGYRRDRIATKDITVYKIAAMDGENMQIIPPYYHDNDVVFGKYYNDGKISVNGKKFMAKMKKMRITYKKFTSTSERKVSFLDRILGKDKSRSIDIERGLHSVEAGTKTMIDMFILPTFEYGTGADVTETQREANKINIFNVISEFLHTGKSTDDSKMVFLMECVIPKWSRYRVNKYGHCVSNALVVKGIKRIPGKSWELESTFGKMLWKPMNIETVYETIPPHE